MKAGNVHMERSSFKFFLLFIDSLYAKSLYFTIFSSKIEFNLFHFLFNEHTTFYEHSSALLGC